MTDVLLFWHPVCDNIIVDAYTSITSIKKKIVKGEVGMAVLKSNQTRVVEIISTYIQHIPMLAILIRLCDTTTSVYRYSYSKSKHAKYMYKY